MTSDQYSDQYRKGGTPPMRRTTFQTLPRTTAVTAGLGVAAALLLAGCGSDKSSGTAGSDPATPSRPASTAPSKPSGCAPRLELSAKDKGHTVCLAEGGKIDLTLDGTKDRPWTPVKATGDALKATNAGIVLQPGDATAAFTAAGTGTVHLTATRPLCPKHKGKVSCQGIEEWTATVTVAAS
ncbi:hypothetical protein AB0C59_22785 [Streptomyces sp. NPDC048664]|uniref:hypothetical protein n=1 Tax=Streptomyces sp. NPDC048664 TaxID=3154505 RepID=UPI0034496F33